MSAHCTAGNVVIGQGRPLVIIAGPCVLESLELGLTIGRHVQAICTRLDLPYIFKASFDKANRSSIASPRGPGLQQGLDWIAQIGRTLSTPTTTDIHEPGHAGPAAEHVDLLQIPAFLCRQTDLLLAAGKAAAARGRGVNVKKGQFVSPTEMGGPVRKLAEAGCENVMLTERGTFFGYNRLVNDFGGVHDLMQLRVKGREHPAPVCFDCTHSTQQPGAGEQTGGRPDLGPVLARAAAAVGVHALFVECHPEPRVALSDSATMIPLAEMDRVLTDVARVHAATRR
ncbi:MAG: 3-deoxy-8-phosphooctulonate synthase [Phycisphaerales bacterium]